MVMKKKKKLHNSCWARAEQFTLNKYTFPEDSANMCTPEED